MVNLGKIFDAQLMLFAQQFKPFIKRKIKEGMTPYANLHGYIYYMEY